MFHITLVGCAQWMGQLKFSNGKSIRYLSPPLLHFSPSHWPLSPSFLFYFHFLPPPPIAFSPSP